MTASDLQTDVKILEAAGLCEGPAHELLCTRCGICGFSYRPMARILISANNNSCVICTQCNADYYHEKMCESKCAECGNPAYWLHALHYISIRRGRLITVAVCSIGCGNQFDSHVARGAAELGIRLRT